MICTEFLPKSALQPNRANIDGGALVTGVSSGSSSTESRTEIEYLSAGHHYVEPITSQQFWFTSRDADTR
jgi:hypothetical protein